MTGDNTEFLAVHYFKTSRVRHWISQELFLNPEFLLLKVYSTIANVGIDFVPSAYPAAEAFGSMQLPCAFIKGNAAGSEGVLRFLQSMVDIDASIRLKEERDALAVLSQGVIGDAIQFALWGYAECYSKFTQPVMRDSMPRPAAEIYCARMREQYMHKDVELLDTNLMHLFKFLCSNIRGSKFFFNDEKPSTCDVVLYSYLSVLLSIPDRFCPYSFAKDQSDDTQEIVHRLRSFLLDFDDYLWQFNAKRAEQIESSKPLLSAALASGELDLPHQPEISADTQPENASKPFLGEDSTARRQNIIFLSAAAAVMAGVIFFSSKRT